MLKVFRRAFTRAEAFFLRHFLYSFRSTMLSLYIPVIVSFILLTGTLSYILAMRQVEDSARHEVENVVYQSRLYVDNRFQSILEQLTALTSDPIVLQLMSKSASEITPADYLAIQSQVDTIRLYNSSIIDSVYINMNDGEFSFFRGDSDYLAVRERFANYRRLPEFAAGGSDIHWHREDNGLTPAMDVFRIVGSGGAERDGVLLFRLREDFFASIFSRPILGGDGYLTLIGESGEDVPLMHDKELRLDSGTVMRLASATGAGHFAFTNDAGTELIAVYDTLETNHWKLVAIFRRDALLDKLEYIKYTTVFMIFVLLTLAIFLTNWLADYIMRPLSDLAARMERMRGGTITAAQLKGTAAPPTDAVTAIGHGVDDLMGHVHELMAQVKKDQELQRELELSVVQMQVHPHFLYNTLFAIKGLCDMGLNEEASKMIMSLANFFRIGLSRGQEIISVEQEVDHARNYLYIQEMRYGDVFRYEIDIEPAMEKYSIIKLTLQPLIENAIYHGVKMKRGQGLIAIRGWMEGNMLHFSVRDDGMGMTEERLAELRRGLAESRTGKGHIGFGVFSVFERLRLHYGETAGMEIQSEYGEGTTIEIVLPARMGEKQGKTGEK